MPKISAAMIMAAGKGTRLRPLTETLPKPLIPIKGKPMLQHIIEALLSLGVHQIVVNTHYLAEKISTFLKDHFPQVKESFEHVLLETGGGVKQALPLLGEEAFLVINADTFWQQGWREPLLTLVNSWDKSYMDALLLLVSQAHAKSSQGKGDYFTQEGEAPYLLKRRCCDEDPMAPYIYSGAMITSAAAYQGFSESVFSNLLLFDRLESQQRLRGVVEARDWFDITSLQGYTIAKQALEQEE